MRYHIEVNHKDDSETVDKHKNESVDNQEKSPRISDESGELTRIDHIPESEEEDQSLLGTSLPNEVVGKFIVNETVLENQTLNGQTEDISNVPNINGKKSTIVEFLNNHDISNDGLGETTSDLVLKSTNYLGQNSWGQEEFEFHAENKSMIENYSTPYPSFNEPSNSGVLGESNIELTNQNEAPITDKTVCNNPEKNPSPNEMSKSNIDGNLNDSSFHPNANSTLSKESNVLDNQEEFNAGPAINLENEIQEEQNDDEIPDFSVESETQMRNRLREAIKSDDPWTASRLVDELKWKSKQLVKDSRIHKKIVLGVIKIDSEQDKYKCELCGKAFAVFGRLQIHLKKNHQESPITNDGEDLKTVEEDDNSNEIPDLSKEKNIITSSLCTLYF